MSHKFEIFYKFIQLLTVCTRDFNLEQEFISYSDHVYLQRNEGVNNGEGKDVGANVGANVEAIPKTFAWQKDRRQSEGEVNLWARILNL